MSTRTPQVHCHVPVRVRVVGTPTDDDLTALRDSVRRLVRLRIAEAEELLDRLAPSRAESTETRQTEQPVERFDPDRELLPDGQLDGYVVPSYDHRGRPTAVPLQQTYIPGFDWRVLRALSLRMRVGDYLDYLEQVVEADAEPGERSLPARVLYADWEDDVRRLIVWLVETHRSTDLAPLVDAVVDRALVLDPPPTGMDLLNAGSAADSARTQLASRDDSGQVARLPSLAVRNARRVTGSGSATRVLRRGLVLWTGMALPVITPSTTLDVGVLTPLSMTVAEAAFCVNTTDFETTFGLTWPAYLAEVGARPVTVEMLAMRVRVDLAAAAASQLAAMAYDEARAGRTTPDGTTPAFRTFAVERTSPPRVIDAARQLATALPAVQPGRPGPHPVDGPRARPGMFMVHAVAYLPTDPELLGAAQQRPVAAPLAEAVRRMLRRDTTDRMWKYAMYDFLATTFRYSFRDGRPPGGTTFEFVLADLERSGDLDRLFDAVEGSRWYALQMRLIQLCLATTYAGHARVTGLLGRLRANALAARQHTYHETVDASTPGGIDLDRDSAKRVSIGVPGRDVLAAADSIFTQERTEKQIKPETATRFRQALIEAREALLADVAAGRLARTMTPDEYLQEAIRRAAVAARITDDDFTDVTIQRSIRIRQVTRRDIENLPSWDVTFEIVERAAGTASWTAVSSSITETADDFEARLIYWQLGRAGEVYQAMLIGITIVGVAVVAWEAGIVAFLVEIAGGATVVLTSMGISVLIYIIRVIFFDARLSVEGFLMAAVEGYLGALGFRAGAFVARPLGRAIGTATVRRVWTGIIAEKLVAGIVGGGLTEGLSLFAEDIVNVVVRDGSFHSATAYAQRIGVGAAMGVIGEFTISPVLHALGASGSTALRSAADLVQQLRRDGVTLEAFAAAASDGLGRMRFALTEVMADAAARGYTAAFAARAEEVLSAWGARTVARRVLEIEGAQFTRSAVAGLERFVALGDGSAMSQEAALRLSRTFAAHPQETVHFLEVLAALDDAAAARLMRGTFSTEADLAAFLGRMGRYTPAQQRGVLNMLVEADVVASPAVITRTAADVIDQQYAMALRIEARAARNEAARLRRRAQDLLATADALDHNPRRAGVFRNQAAQAERDALAQDSLAESLEAGADPRPGPVGVPPPTVADDPSALQAELDAAFAALEAGTGGRPQAWIRLPAHRGLTAPEADSLVRTVFTSRSGNPVVFRIEGGTGDMASREFISIGADGRVGVSTGGRDLNINVGVFERAVEFLLEHRPGARLKVFEVDGEWLRNLRGIANPEQGRAASLVPVDALGHPTGPPLRPAGTIADVPGLRTVDTRQAANQLQLDAELMPELREFIVPNSGRMIEFTARSGTGAAVRTGGGTP